MSRIEFTPSFLVAASEIVATTKAAEKARDEKLVTAERERFRLLMRGQLRNRENEKVTPPEATPETQNENQPPIDQYETRLKQLQEEMKARGMGSFLKTLYDLSQSEEK